MWKIQVDNFRALDAAVGSCTMEDTIEERDTLDNKFNIIKGI